MGAVQRSEIGPLQALGRRQRNQMQAISVGQGCTRVRRDRRKELLLVVWELHLSRSLFPLRTTVPRGGEGREGSVGHGSSQNRSPRFPAPTNTINHRHHHYHHHPEVVVTECPTSQRSAPCCRSCAETRLIAASRRKESSQTGTTGCVSGLFLLSVRSYPMRTSNRSIALLLIVKGAGGWERDAASHQSKRLRDGGRLQQTIWNDSFPRRVDKAGPAPSLVGQSVRVGS